MTDVEREENARLEDCQARIEANLREIALRLDDYARDIQDANTHMWEARRDMDHIDKVAMRESIEQRRRSTQVLQEQRVKLVKLRKSPYFGRFDFARAGRDAQAQPVYVGIHDFRDEIAGEAVVHDWRAPISSLFYDFETGAAHYSAPSGTIAGEIIRKRQFRIRDGKLELAIESGVNIVDDVLQDALGAASDEGMKNIVATIQRDQNAIIRDGDAHTLIIQGVAGSGKTSIALHRIAFLLYRFKDTLQSSDILILSPNRVFADYIGNVLPELGEEQVGEIGIEALADTLLDGKFKFQSFFEQTAALTEKRDPAFEQRIAAKAKLALLKKIDAYVDHLEEQSFTAREWRSGLKIVPDWHFAETWNRNKGLPTNQRITEVVNTTAHKVFMHYKQELETRERRDLRDAVTGMVKRTTLRAAYKGFYEWLGHPEMFRPKGSVLEYADVFPLIWLKLRLEGIENPYKGVKHLLVDEMQDYTPVQYAVLGKLFSCRKTILGDAAQSVSPAGGASPDQIAKILRTMAPVKLMRSYRSTYEIMQFALAIAPNAELVPMKRHGEPPQVLTVADNAAAQGILRREIAAFRASEHHSLAVIAKTQKEARRLSDALQAAGEKVRLLDAQSTGFSTGIVICTAHLAKGLEFDRVVVWDASAKTYQSTLDRNLLYVACTRAMHRLDLISIGEQSPLVPQTAIAA